MSNDHSARSRTDDTDDTDDIDDADRSRPKRRAILGSIGAVTGLAALTGSPAGAAAAQEYDDPEVLCTRRCSDSYATEDDWSTSALTVQGCPDGTGGELRLQVTGQLGLERFDPPERTPTDGTEGRRDSDGARTTQEQSVTIQQEQVVESDGGTETAQTQTIVIEQEQVTTTESSDDAVEGSAGTEESDEVEFPSVTVHVEPGEKRHIWYTGTIVGLHMSNTDLNIAIANRMPY